jgi:flagellar protein FlbT
MAFVYETLTMLGKDCDLIDQKRQRTTVEAAPTFPPMSLYLVTARTSTKGEPGMALKVELKPNERIIIGTCVITNTDQRARLLIDGDKVPILREKDILTPATADTPAKLIYLAVQLMYLSPDPMAHHPTYFSLVRDIMSAAPSAWPFIENINNHILNGDLYHALKEAKKLIGHEEKLIQSAREFQAAGGGGKADRKSA